MLFGRAILVCLTVCCLAWSANADYYHPYYDYDPGYDGEWQVTYGCWIPADPKIQVHGCQFETDTLQFTYGCCLHFNETGRDQIWMTCAYEGQRCLGKGSYITGNKTVDHPVIPPWWTTALPWTYEGSTVGIDDDQWTGHNVQAIVIMSIIAGILLIGGGVICCCKCSACCNKRRPDDLVSLISQDDIGMPAPPRRPIVPIRRLGRPGISKAVIINVQHIEVNARQSGLPTYDEAERENTAKTTLPSV